jgi:hypothetical protein
LAATKELLGDAVNDEKEKDFKNSMIEILCDFDSGSTAAFMKILYNRNSSIKSFIFLLFLNLILFYSSYTGTHQSDYKSAEQSHGYFLRPKQRYAQST